MGYFYPDFRKNEDKLYSFRQELQYNAVLDVEFSDEEETEPVTLEEARLWCKRDVTEDDDLITELITSARIVCEEYTNISFIPRTVTACLNNSLGGIYLPYGPVKEITSVLDSESNEPDYEVRNPLFKQLVYPTYDFITIVYTTGYNELPKKLKTGLLNQIAWMYQNRGDEKLASQLSEQAKLILKTVRRV